MSDDFQNGTAVLMSEKKCKIGAHLHFEAKKKHYLVSF